jgi:hypothetical protein
MINPCMSLNSNFEPTKFSTPKALICITCGESSRTMSRPHNKVTVNWSSHNYFSHCQNMVILECVASISLALISEAYCNNPNTHQTFSSPEILSKAVKVRIACMYSKVCGLLYAFPTPDNSGRWIGAGFVSSN